MTVQNVVRRAEEMGLQTIAFTEHVRKASGWTTEYLREIECVNSRIRIIPGFEAKILRDGSVDCPGNIAGKYFLVASFHTKYEDKQEWLKVLKTAIINPNVDVIGHLAPESTFDLDRNELEDLARLIVENKKIVELNAKYHRPPKAWVRIFGKAGVRFHVGSDAHSIEEIGNFERISDLVSIVDGEMPSSESQLMMR